MWPRFTPLQTRPEDAAIGGSLSRGQTLSTVSALVLDPNSRRKAFTLVNDSSVAIYISKVEPAVVNTGIRLNANGGSYVNPDLAGRMWLGPIYAVGLSGTPVLCITEDW